jgi:hypothetical protein
MHKIRIVLPGETAHGLVELDGKELQGVTSINLSVFAHSEVCVSLTLRGLVEIEGELTDSEIIRAERKP